MQRASSAIVAMILAIALYFVLFWGFDALRILTSPTYGLEDVWRSQVIFGIGRLAGFGPEGLIKLAAVFGALKLTVAGGCAVHVLDRLRAMIMGTGSDNEILETGLLLAVVISIASVTPAVWSGNADLIREHTIQLALAALAAVLCMIERSGRKAAPRAAVEADDMDIDTAAPATVPAAQAAAQAEWFTPWRR
jgi:hypothetical protein